MQSQHRVVHHLSYRQDIENSYTWKKWWRELRGCVFVASRSFLVCSSRGWSLLLFFLARRETRRRGGSSRQGWDRTSPSSTSKPSCNVQWGWNAENMESLIQGGTELMGTQNMYTRIYYMAIDSTLEINHCCVMFLLACCYYYSG